MATTYGCWVVAGYPELAVDTDVGALKKREEAGTGGMNGDDAGKPGYNSAVVVSPTGEVVGNYRKSFLFDTDKTWAREDMNPKDFLAPFDAYELANYVKTAQADTLIVPMNWLQPPPEPSDDPASVEAAHRRENSPNENDAGPEMSTLNYWAHRLMPLHDPAPTYLPPPNDDTTRGGTQGEQGAKEVVFVACNRVGTENAMTTTDKVYPVKTEFGPARD
ncbi:hypothetical protein QFC19_001228 [Naganishia cerealis]|uniref:Uncharacterized protein n=1 Tax=Naganishia cerealis TaxID=610337 RepID=A0ACC2WI97_9TREE|nr:hypothetical protein QFC19_001228 [Naganishia cerealis]